MSNVLNYKNLSKLDKHTIHTSCKHHACIWCYSVLSYHLVFPELNLENEQDYHYHDDHHSSVDFYHKSFTDSINTSDKYN